MPKGSRLPHRLGPRWPAWLVVGGPVFVTVVWVVVGLFLVRDETLKPHQLKMGVFLLGAMILLCVLALSRTLGTALFAGSTTVEVSLRPARRGETLRCFVIQRGAGLKGVDVRLECLRLAGRGSEKAVVDLPVGTAGVSGLRVQLEAAILIPSDAPPTEINRVRWRIRVAATFHAVPQVVREFPLTVV